MFLRRSDRRALLFLFVIIVAVWGGILLDRWLWQPRQPLASLDEAAMDSLDSRVGESGYWQPSQGTSAASKSYAVPVQEAETFPFDPNTADSTTLLRLGLTSWQVRNIYKYRARGGRYHASEDFKRLYGMTPELWNRLSPVIRIGEQFRYYTDADYAVDDARRQQQRQRRDSLRQARHDSLSSRYPRQEKFEELTQLDLNTVDSVELKKVPGIASYRARQILRYRDRLGGFVSTDQLFEIENFPADELAVWFKVETGILRRLNLNTASFSELSRHPYIGYARARAIDAYRRNQGTIHSLDDLQLLPDFSDDVRRRLEPYVTY